MLDFLYFYLVFVCIRRSVMYRTLVFHRIRSFVPIISAKKEGREMQYVRIDQVDPSSNVLAHIPSSSCSLFRTGSNASFLFFPFSSSHLDHTAPLGEVHALGRSSVAEPANALAGALVDQSARKLAALLRLENALQHVLLSRAGSDESNARGVLHDGQREGNALGRRLRRVLNAENPGAGLAQLRVAGEQRASVAVGTAAE